MLSLPDNDQDGVIEAFNSTIRYLDNLLNINNRYFKQSLSKIYLTELQLNKVSLSKLKLFKALTCPYIIA